MSKVDDILANTDFDSALGGLDLEGSNQKVEEMRNGGGEAIVPSKDDDKCTSGACAI